MLRFSTWKIMAVLLLAFGSIAYTLPSLFSKAQLKAWEQSIPGFVPKWLVPHKAITLGLDLQGGAHLLLEVDTQSVVRQQAEQIRNDVRNILREERVALAGGLVLQPRGVAFRLPEGADRAKVMARLRTLAQPQANALLGTSGPQLIQITEAEGGAIQMAITDAGVQERIGNAIVRSIEVIRKRVDPDGTTEPNIQRQGADRVLLQVPGATDAEEVKRRVGSTAELGHT
jgi:preprotein translocase subunit SecD